MMKFTHLVPRSRIFLFSLLQCPLNSVLVSVSLCLCAVYPYPVPPIEENMLDERKQLLKPWDTKKVRREWERKNIAFIYHQSLEKVIGVGFRICQLAIS